MKELFELFVTFARVGGFTFGGGYAMLPMLQKEIVENKKWATEEEVSDYYALGQCTPGAIAINTATFIGYKNKGILGGIFATLGMIFPSIVIISLISAFLGNFAEVEVVKHAFAGIRVCVCVLVFQAVFKMWKTSVKDWKCLVLFVIVLMLSIFTEISSPIIVVGAGVFGIFVKLISKHREKRLAKK